MLFGPGVQRDALGPYARAMWTSMMLTPIEIVVVLGIGLVAGTIGAMAGLGGSLFILPALLVVFGAGDESGSRYHLYMAAALTVNVFVAAPATVRHLRSGLIGARLLVPVIPAMIVCALVGVTLSNAAQGVWLARALGLVNLAMVVYAGVSKRMRSQDDRAERTAMGDVESDASHTQQGDALPSSVPSQSRVSAGPLVGVAAGAGLFSGAMGVGGGVVLVPGLRAVGGLPLRQAAATSTAAICCTAAFAASAKIATLHTHNQSWGAALVLAGAMVPGAVVGSLIGAELVRRLPIGPLRLVTTIILLIAAGRLLCTGIELPV